MSQDDFHERSGGLFVPEQMLPSQYFDRLRRRSDLTGAQRLMCAIIEDAVDVYLKHAAARRPLHRRLFDAAEAWIESDEAGWLYSFVAICDHLGLDADRLRAGLRARKAAARAGTEQPSASPPLDVETYRRAGNE